MFRKLVSGLPYSPALVGQLGFYAKRLRKEQATRRLGLMFTALALVMQSFAVFSPPEPANAASDSDFIRGGVSSLDDVLAVYDRSARGNGDFKQIMDYAGVTRAELAAAKDSSVNSRQFGVGSGAMLSWGRVSKFSSSEGEVKHIVPVSDSKTSNIFSRPLWRYDSTSHTQRNGSTYEAFIGRSAKLGWFAIMKNCGNLITTKTPKPAPAGSVEASCSMIRGYAYDARQLSQKVKVYLYIGGVPGKGEKIGPLSASTNSVNSPVGQGYGYSYELPEKYKTDTSTTIVYAVMVPLAGWTSSTVQIGSASIPANCTTPKPTAVAECVSLTHTLIDRTRFNFKATASTKNSATISSYTYTVKNSTGATVAEKVVTSNQVSSESGSLDLKNTGTYTASVVVKSSVGDRTGANCSTSVTVVPIAMCPLNASITKADKDCTPCPGDASIWSKDERCDSNIVQGKEVRNLTDGINDAHNSTVSSGDRIEYTIYAENTGLKAADIEMNEQLSDVLEYAAVSDLGGAQFSATDKVLSWGTLNLDPGEKQVRKFTVQISNTIASTPQGISEPGSYDCVMTNTFGNSTTLNVECPAVKSVEQVVKELPSTGPTANVAFGASLAMVVAYFYARSRQIGKEVRLIRRDFNAGTF